VFHAVLTGVIGFAIAAAAGSPVVALLRSHKVGKAISPDGPQSHTVKAGTPTMGGLLILGTLLLVTFTLNLIWGLPLLVLLIVIALAGLIGLVDDLGTLYGRRQGGLSWRAKLLLFAVISLGAGFVLYHWQGIEQVRIPWVGTVALGFWIVPLALPVLLGTTVATGITDGMDGLLSSTAALAFAAYGIIGAAQGQMFLAAFCFTVVGAVLGFLWYNAYPAQVFMGEIGALPLGAALAIVALLTEQWIVLPLIGIVFFANALSDIIQVLYFKLTRGKRLFRMAPLHNHFELAGWPETKVVARFWLVGAAGAMLGVAVALKG
jgi:phospho-N-acetylmuramoyl-pentapeptide-transferase